MLRENLVREILVRDKHVAPGGIVSKNIQNWWTLFLDDKVRHVKLEARGPHTTPLLVLCGSQ